MPPLRLLSRALAAQEWGWHEGLRLVDRGHEDILRELLLCLHMKRRWRAAVPVYRRLMADQQTGVLENTVELRTIPFDTHSKPWGHNTWYRHRISQPNSEAVDPNHLCAVQIPFSQPPFGQDEYVEACQIEYMVEGGVGFYYVTMHDWTTRCSEPSECVALLDAIDPTALNDDYAVRFRKNVHFRHLERCLCHDDPPRKAYIQRTMDDLERESGGYEWILK
jgi:hypothetical protein